LSRLVLATACLALLAGCGGSGGGKPVAHVGGDTITRNQLDALMAHFRREAQREGNAFPARGTTAYRKLQSQTLGLLVYRVELQQAADRLGVKVDQDKLMKRLAAANGGGEEEGDTNGDTFAHDSVQAQLLTEAIAAKVMRGAHSAAARNRKLAAYLQRLQLRTKVRYEPGYGPGS
jgi:hypothetical protein